MGTSKFINRHNGPRDTEIQGMLDVIGVSSMKELLNQTIPDSILLKKKLKISSAISEHDYLSKIEKIGSQNKVFKTYIGTGYYNTIVPSVIWRNIFENPSWYTSYTPYQAEISQGRLEALLNFQTIVSDLTACEIANASLLDEATAAAEAMIMMSNMRTKEALKINANKIFVDENIYPQTLDVLSLRAEALEIEVVTGDFATFEFDNQVFGAIIQYPGNDGKVHNYSDFTKKAHSNNCMVAVAADLLSLTILTPPGEWGADIVFGTTQRFGIPMGYGGPHAAYFATKEEFKRKLPGRIIGISIDQHGNRALRMALQTREQHIKREKATSNICTAQALLATMAGMYGVYHGPDGLRKIANKIHFTATTLSMKIEKLGFTQLNNMFFDTILVQIPETCSIKSLKKNAESRKINFKYIDSDTISISIDETTSLNDINNILEVLSFTAQSTFSKLKKIEKQSNIEENLVRKSKFMQQSVFNDYHSETEMMRYIKRLERKDMSLTHSMISLGSCTMKLNAASLMLPLSSPKFGNIHPFVPKNQAKGYQKLFKELSEDLIEITGFSGITLQPNSGAAGEYTGLMVIREYQKENGQSNRNIVLIPASAHGTNPASAAMAGMEVIVVACDENGNISMSDLIAKAEKYKDTLSTFMITYPSTHGVFEEGVIEMCNVIHKNGGQVYMDGANMNAQVGITNPGTIGADVCHLNLHKTFAIPHGGGGPGVGPVAVAKHLVKYLPGHPVVKTGGKKAIKAISAAPWGSASVLPITYGYIKMLGGKGLRKVTETAILNANYLAARLKDYYKILYTGNAGRVAHEMILECRNFKQDSGVTESDIAKRLMDYGFHAPTLSFPVHGTLMIEPTESESKQELDRFVDAMISIYNEIKEIADGKASKTSNVLLNAPHSEKILCSNEWTYEYSREKAGFPIDYLKKNKFQIPVSRVDNAYGDRNMVCSCEPIESYM